MVAPAIRRRLVGVDLDLDDRVELPARARSSGFVGLEAGPVIGGGSREVVRCRIRSLRSTVRTCEQARGRAPAPRPPRARPAEPGRSTRRAVPCSCGLDFLGSDLRDDDSSAGGDPDGRNLEVVLTNTRRARRSGEHRSVVVRTNLDLVGGVLDLGVASTDRRVWIHRGAVAGMEVVL